MGRLSLGAVLFGVCVLSVSAADTDALIKDLKAKEAKTRLKAAESLGSVPEDDKVTIALADAMFDSNTGVATAAVKSLEKQRPDLYKPLLTMMIDKALSARTKAAAELAGLGEKAKPAVRAMTGIAKRDIQTYLAPTGSGGSPSKDSGLGVHIKANLKEIKKIGITDKEVAAVMSAIANTAEAPGRFTALEALAEWAKREKEDAVFFAAVKPWFTDKQWHYQVAACNAVTDFGEPAKKEFGKTLESLKLSNIKAVRDAATEALDTLSK